MGLLKMAGRGRARNGKIEPEAAGIKCRRYQGRAVSPEFVKSRVKVGRAGAGAMHRARLGKQA
jgi:hypothetical protein